MKPYSPSRIAVVLSSLSSGGAERVGVHVAALLQRKGYHVTVITIASNARDYYTLPDGVKRYALGLDGPSHTGWQRVLSNWQRVITLKRILNECGPLGLTISFLTETNVLMLLATRGMSTKTVVCEQNHPRAVSRMWRSLSRCTYWLADRLVSCSAGADGTYSWMPSKKRCVIFNPVEIDQRDAMPYTARPKKIVAMGRLVHQKGFDILIEALALSASELAGWQVEIAGVGPLRDQLEEKIAAHGMSSWVRFVGLVNPPATLLETARFFVLSSRFEGFGNVLVEALACGTPVLATDCPYGPSEIVQPGVNGMLVAPESVEDLAKGLEHLATNQPLCEGLAHAARDSIASFGMQVIEKKWHELVQGLVG